MAFTNLSVKDASGTSKTVATHLKGGSDHYTAHVLATNSEGGCTTYRNNDLDENGVNIKASAGTVYGLVAMNTNAAARYLRLYNKATAPNSGDTPRMTILLAAGPSQRDINFAGAMGVDFGTGIGVRATTGSGDADTGAPSANDIYISLFYA